MPNIHTSSAGTRYPLRAVQFSSVPPKKNPNSDKKCATEIDTYLPQQPDSRVRKKDDECPACPMRRAYVRPTHRSRGHTVCHVTNDERAACVRWCVCVSARACFCLARCASCGPVTYPQCLDRGAVLSVVALFCIW